MEDSKKLNTVLLVDDDDVTNFIAKQKLEKAGVTNDVVITSDGQEALDYLCNADNNIPDLILLDITMPVMDGYEFLKKFSQTGGKARDISKIIILSSSYRDEEIKQVADYDEVIGYMEKPLTEEKIQKMVRHYYSKTDQQKL